MFEHGFPPYWSTIKKLIWLVGTGIVSGVTEIWETVTGTLIHITNALASPMRKCEVTLEPIQDLHGQDAPYPAGGGKNKLNEATNTIGKAINASGKIVTTAGENGGQYTDLIPVTGGQTYTISAVSGTSNQWSRRVHAYDSNGDWVRQIAAISTSSGITAGTTYTITVTIESGESYVRYSYPGVDTKAQCESGSTATAWSPYSNICPITGWTGCEVWNDPKYGDTIYWNQLIPAYGVAENTMGGITYRSVGDGSITFSGKATSAFGINIVNPYPQYISGHKYLIIGCPSGGSNQTYSLRYNGNGFGENGNGIIVEAVTGSAGTDLLVGSKYPVIFIANGTEIITPIVFKPQVFDLTEMFGEGNEPATVSAFKALFPKDYYTYNAGTETTVSAVNGDPYQHLSVTFPDSTGTVYGGTVDLVTGEMVVDRGIIDLGILNWEASQTRNRIVAVLEDAKQFSNLYTQEGNIPEKLTCSIYKTISGNAGYEGTNYDFAISGSYWNGQNKLQVNDSRYSDGATFKTAMSGVQLVYKLATPTEIQLTPQEISTLAGENNIWGDGTITAIYKATE